MCRGRPVTMGCRSKRSASRDPFMPSAMGRTAPQVLHLLFQTAGKRAFAYRREPSLAK